MKHSDSIQKSRNAASKKPCTTQARSGPRFNSSAPNAMRTASAICAPSEVETISHVAKVFTAHAREEARVQEHLRNVQSTRERVCQAVTDAIQMNVPAPATPAPLNHDTAPLILAPSVHATTASTSPAPGTRTSSRRARAARRSRILRAVHIWCRRAARQCYAQKSQTSVMSNSDFAGFFILHFCAVLIGGLIAKYM